MKDEEIRIHLIELLESQGEKIRVFEEFSMGKARSDLLTVTQELTGYEIKSDSDSYQRLSRQIPYYDKYFDKNYLVVGAKHRRSAPAKVPPHWGLLCFFEDPATETIAIETLRPAAPNPKISRRAQLDLLWREELKNILRRRQMPLYSQKRKYVLITALLKALTDNELRTELREELFERDYTL